MSEIRSESCPGEICPSLRRSGRPSRGIPEKSANFLIATVVVERDLEAFVAERLELWEKNYASPGFGVWLTNYPEVFLTPEANAV